VRADLDDAASLYHYAKFLDKACDRVKDAEEIYLHSLERDPNMIACLKELRADLCSVHVTALTVRARVCLCRYALFLSDKRNMKEESVRFDRRAHAIQMLQMPTGVPAPTTAATLHTVSSTTPSTAHSSDDKSVSLRRSPSSPVLPRPTAVVGTPKSARRIADTSTMPQPKTATLPSKRNKGSFSVAADAPSATSATAAAKTATTAVTASSTSPSASSASSNELEAKKSKRSSLPPGRVVSGGSSADLHPMQSLATTSAEANELAPSARLLAKSSEKVVSPRRRAYTLQVRDHACDVCPCAQLRRRRARSPLAAARRSRCQAF
jgi:hypothetical protein